MNQQIIEKFPDLFALPAEEAREILGEVGVSYYEEFFSGHVSPQVYIEKVKLMARLLRVEGCSVLDIGCGNGIITCLLEGFGASRAVGVDIAESKIPYCHSLVEWLGCTRSEFKLSDGQSLPFDDETFDCVTTSAALSHVHDIDKTLLEMRRILKPGGRIYVFEDNNAMHYAYLKNMSRVWTFAETGEITGGLQPKHSMVPFLEVRARMIREWFPDLEENAVKRYAQDTKGYVQDEIRERVQQAMDSGQPVVRKEGFTCYNPETSEALEYPFTPPILRDFVGKYFADTQIHSGLTPPFKGIRGVAKRFLMIAGKLLPPLMYRTHPIYIATGVKA